MINLVLSIALVDSVPRGCALDMHLIESLGEPLDLAPTVTSGRRHTQRTGKERNRSNQTVTEEFEGSRHDVYSTPRSAQ
jgi:hypothetical protein